MLFSQTEYTLFRVHEFPYQLDIDIFQLHLLHIIGVESEQILVTQVV